MTLAGQFTRQDVIGTLIPGAVFLLGLAPLFPHGTAISSIRDATVGLIAAFILGGILHGVARQIEATTGISSSREVFSEEVCDPARLHDELVAQFLDRFHDRFGSETLPSDRSELTPGDCHAMFDLAHARIHAADGVRTREVSTKLEYYGSMWVAMSLLYASYLLYVLALLFLDVDAVYTSYVSRLGVAPFDLFVVASVLISLGYVLFRWLRHNYGVLFAKQLMADFVTVEHLG